MKTLVIIDTIIIAIVATIIGFVATIIGWLVFAPLDPGSASSAAANTNAEFMFVWDTNKVRPVPEHYSIVWNGYGDLVIPNPEYVHVFPPNIYFRDETGQRWSAEWVKE